MADVAPKDPAPSCPDVYGILPGPAGFAPRSLNGTADVSRVGLREKLRTRSKQRQELLALSLGADQSQKLSQVLGNLDDKQETEEPPEKKLQGSLPEEEDTKDHAVLVVAKFDETPTQNRRKKSPKEHSWRAESDEDVEIEDVAKVMQEDGLSSIYEGSKTFLKGTQSANPHNDYSQHFVDSGQRPQNFIRDSGLAERFEEYPKLKELIKLKDDLVAATATPPMYWKCDFLNTDLSEIGCKFDVIIIEPPLEEYSQVSGRSDDSWTWHMIEQLNIPAVADWRCFIWLWCGSSPDGLSAGRRCLQQWGFRRCEDICWIKTNMKDREKRGLLDSKSLFQRTKEHCLMGIKGTVRRSVDGDYIHANVDIDIIITDDPPERDLRKPDEIFLVAEHFCLGRRRLHVFGRDDTIRPGWLSVGPALTSSNFDLQRYRSFFEEEPGLTTGCTERIETLRPKSPPPKTQPASANVNMGSGGGTQSGSNLSQGLGHSFPGGSISSDSASGPRGSGGAYISRGRAGWGTGTGWKRRQQ